MRNGAKTRADSRFAEAMVGISGLTRVRSWLARVPYPVICTLLGLILGWLPALLHGPIPQKFNVLYIQGAIAIWAYYTARLLIGFLVGISVYPARWYLRGPLCGLLAMLPVSLISLATPGCGPP
jgi:hypothetical protein